MNERIVELGLGPDCEWVATMEWPEGETQGGPAMLVIRPSNEDEYPTGGLSQTVLREVDFKSALERLRGQLASSDKWQRHRQESRDKIYALLTKVAASGSISDEYLALLSRAYVGAVNEGQSKPLEFLAAIADKSNAAIKNHLWQATRKGFLERSPGRAGGRITAKTSDALMDILYPDGAPFARLGRSGSAVSDT